MIDLHIHTINSDGALTPKEIVDEAVKNNVTTIAVADHDTLEAYSKDFLEYANINNIEVIKAVEMFTKLGKLGIHILGYNFDINNKELRDKLLRLRNARHDYLYNVSNKLKECGYIVDTEDLDKITSVTKAHIAKDVIGNKLNREKLIEEFGIIPDMGYFIETIMNYGCKAYIEKESLTPFEARDLIKNAGGKVVLAHPVCYKYEDNLEYEEVVKLIKDIKPDAIEGNYIYHDKNNDKINEVDKWNKLAQSKNLISTLGSDFHNYGKNDIGLINDIKLTNEEENRILEFIRGE